MTDNVLDSVGREGGDELSRLCRRIKELEQERDELEAFNYMVAHDLYAPLMRVEGYSDILLKGYAPLLDSSGEIYLRRVVRAAQQAKHLLNELLNLSRATHSELLRQDVDISLMAQDILHEYCEAEPLRKVELRLAPGLTVHADPVLMRLVLMNLLGNAWKYTATREVATIELGVDETAGGETYYVKDNGVGFPSEAARELFVPFRRFCHLGCFEGSGIGLAIVGRVVARHGGKVWAEGAPDAGAAFYFSLPAIG